MGGIGQNQSKVYLQVKYRTMQPAVAFRKTHFVLSYGDIVMVLTGRMFRLNKTIASSVVEECSVTELQLGRPGKAVRSYPPLITNSLVNNGKIVFFLPGTSMFLKYVS